MLEEFTGEYQGQPAILMMMRDAYGNYVIQKALDVCQGADRERLINGIKEHLPALRKFTYGKHIIAHIEKLEAQGSGRSGRVGVGYSGRGGGGAGADYDRPRRDGDSDGRGDAGGRADGIGRDDVGRGGDRPGDRGAPGFGRPVR